MNAEQEKAIDPDGYVIAAAKILDGLKLVIGQDVNEFAMPFIVQTIKNNVRDNQQLAEFKRKLKEEIVKKSLQIDDAYTLTENEILTLIDTL